VAAPSLMEPSVKSARRPSARFLDRTSVTSTIAFVSERSSGPSSAELSYVADSIIGRRCARRGTGFVRFAVESGATVEEGQLVCVMEAMNMENGITAHKSATIR
jgi:biotin carboxyl carrier protein